MGWEPHPIIIYTDCKPIVEMLNGLTRKVIMSLMGIINDVSLEWWWWEKKHISEKDNQFADCLSRIRMPEDIKREENFKYKKGKN